MLHNQSSVFSSPRKGNTAWVSRVILWLSLFLSFNLILFASLIIINWLCYWVTRDTFFTEAWMKPVLLLGGTFLGGAFIRAKMETYGGGLALFTVAILSLGSYTYLTYQDMLNLGQVYSRWMPKIWGSGMLDYVLLLPAVGMGGMLLYRYFTLKPKTRF